MILGCPFPSLQSLMILSGGGLVGRGEVRGCDLGMSLPILPSHPLAAALSVRASAVLPSSSLSLLSSEALEPGHSCLPGKRPLGCWLQGPALLPMQVCRGCIRCCSVDAHCPERPSLLGK